jgi:hypothetical protein
MRLRLNGYALLVAASALAFRLDAIADGAEPVAAAVTSCDSQEYRQFDFWIGTWTVSEDGKPAGRNGIEATLNHCALFESWSSVDGSHGRSMNFYDRERHQWHQSWIDDRGGALELDGGMVGKSMVLEGDRPDPASGGSVRHRITWTPLADGTVRQHWQRMKTAKSDWETVFDGLYKRVP